MLNDEISLNFILYFVTHTVLFLLLIYLVTWGWPNRRAETCRQPNNNVNTYKQLCFDSQISFSLCQECWNWKDEMTTGMRCTRIMLLARMHISRFLWINTANTTTTIITITIIITITTTTTIIVMPSRNFAPWPVSVVLLQCRILCSCFRAFWINVNNWPTRCDYIQFYYISADSSTCFGWYPHPSSGAHSNCNYNIWYWSNRICYRPLTRFVRITIQRFICWDKPKEISENYGISQSGKKT